MRALTICVRMSEAVCPSEGLYEPGSSQPSKLPLASAGRMPAPSPSMIDWKSLSGRPVTCAALVMTSLTRSPGLTSMNPPACAWSDSTASTSEAFIWYCRLKVPGYSVELPAMLVRASGDLMMSCSVRFCATVCQSLPLSTVNCTLPLPGPG